LSPKNTKKSSLKTPTPLCKPHSSKIFSSQKCSLKTPFKKLWFRLKIRSSQFWISRHSLRYSILSTKSKQLNRLWRVLRNRWDI
jgi:hypothetical protein